MRRGSPNASSVKVIQRPSDLEGSDANLYTGAVNGGTSQLYQQLILRPTPGFGRAETPSRTCTSAAQAPAPAAEFTAYAVATPRERHSAAWASPAGRADGSPVQSCP